MDLTVDCAAADGRVALIGDAAHAMPASQGEGANCALESAVALLASLPPAADERPPSIDELSAAQLLARSGLERECRVLTK